MKLMEETKLFVPVNDTKLFCYTYGNHHSPIIVLHGGPGLGCNYLLPQMSAIGNFSFAIFYDQRGTGNSAANNDWYANPLQTYVDDINQVREAFGFKTVSLLGHSYGGIFAALYALAYPEHVDKIIYLNPVPASSHDYLAFVKHRSQIVDTHKSELDTIRKSSAFLQGDPQTVENYYRIYFTNYFAKPNLAHTLTLTMTPEAAINNFKIYDLFYKYITNNSFNLYEKLKTLNKPSLVIACDKDVIPIEYIRRLHESIPASTFTLIKDSGHFPYIDQPKILFNILKDFMAVK